MKDLRKIDLQTTVRGLRLRATEPCARYRRYHTVCVHPDVTEYGDARVVTYPATPTRSEGRLWQRDGKIIDPGVARRSGIGEDKGLYCDVLGEHIPPDDPEVQALRAELELLDREWTAAHAEELRAEDERTKVVAAAHAADDEFGRSLPLPPLETECLECGAVYDEPGHVEAGGMACDRCG